MIRTLHELWKILTPLDQRKLCVVLLLVLFMALIEAAGVVSIMPFLAVLANPTSIDSNELLKGIYQFSNADTNQKFIVYLGIFSLVVVLISTALKITTQYSLNRFANLQRHYFSTRLLQIYLQQSYQFFTQNNSAKLIKNILSEVDQVIYAMILPALNMISYGVVIIAMMLVLLFYDPIMALCTATILSAFYLTTYYFIRKKMDQIGTSFSHANTERYQACQEALGGIKDVMINNAKQGYVEHFERNSRIYAQHIATRDTLSQIPLYMVETIGYGCIIILAIILVVTGKNVSHILPILGLYGLAAYRMLPAAQNVYRAVSHIRFSNNLFLQLKQELELELQPNIILESSNNLQFNHQICLDNISYSYPNRSGKKIFNNFNYTIKKNSSVGIVGVSGSGKTTLMDIMLGLLEPQSGQVLIDGVALNASNVQTWRDKVGYVPQSIYLTDKSIAENIAFGIAKSQIDMVAVTHAAKQAHIDEFITQLPEGYLTTVGERGVMLSGGQKQRIGIARALYKNPDVLFMDEATSSLDIETEQAINQSIHNLNGLKTIIIIAHRHSAVVQCTKIIQLAS